MATEDKAKALLDLMVDEMHSMLTNGKAVVDKESGEIVKVSPDAATLNVIRQFLKDQNIGVTKDNSKARDIATVLPFPPTLVKDKSA